MNELRNKIYMLRFTPSEYSAVIRAYNSYIARHGNIPLSQWVRKAVLRNIRKEFKLSSELVSFESQLRAHVGNKELCESILFDVKLLLSKTR